MTMRTTHGLKTRPRVRRSFAGTVLLWLYSLNTLFILIYLIWNSMRAKSDLLSNTLGFPKKFSLGSYGRLLGEGKFYTYIVSSVVILAASLFLIVMLSSMVAYGLGRFRFKGRDALQLFFLIGLMFPIQLGIVPIFLLIRDWGLLDTQAGVVLVSAAGISLPVFLLTTFFGGLPKDIYESGKMDGASEWRIFYRIMFPLASPVIFSICMIMSVQIWNQFFVPIIFLQTEAKKTIPLAIMKYTSNLIYNIDLALAASVIATIPILTLFFIFSEKILDGVASGGVKE